MNDLVRYLLGSSAITVALIAIVQAVLKVYENRQSGRAAASAAEVESKRREEQEAELLNAAYRQTIEAHLPYDLEIISDLRDLRREVDDLRQAVNLPRKDWPPLPKAPPLFPPPPKG